MSYFLYHLRLTHEAAARFAYDCAQAFVICASSPHAAREVAAINAGDEKPDTWRDPKLTKCAKIGVATHCPTGVIVQDFYES